jgi:2-hydroxychromene-2-carboxylate isomerase
VPAVDFYFDPTCPWTWLTSRWLADAAAHRADTTVTWRPLSLRVLRGGELHPKYAERTLAGVRAHRLLAALAAERTERSNQQVAALYGAIGALTFQADATLTDALVDQAVEDAGLDDRAALLDDESLDAAVERSTKEAMDLAGPDVGSPVLAWGEPRVGIFGPILTPGPRGEAAARLLDVVLELGAVDGFFELKRGRTSGPALPAEPWGTQAPDA